MAVKTVFKAFMKYAVSAAYFFGLNIDICS